MEYETLLTEIKRLKEENDYLKKLLKRNNIDYIMPEVIENKTYTTEDKINIYMSYFKGRDDVYAIRYFDKKTGKKKYCPLCLNRFKNDLCDRQKYPQCKGCPNKSYEGINKETLLAHFKGIKAYGIYPMLDNDECYFLATDFDGNNYFKEALTFKNCAKSIGIDSIIEISQSGNGAHVWIFFENKIKAKDARKIADFILNNAIDKCKSISFSAFDRFFPAQDYLLKDKIGNCIALPLNGECVKRGCNLFVDDNKIPFPNQIAYLNGVKKVSDSVVKIILLHIKERGETEPLSKNLLKNINVKQEDFAMPLEIVLDNNISILKKSLSDKALKFIMRLSSILNRKFYELQSIRQSTYGVPRVLQLFKEDDEFIRIPRGCLEDLEMVLRYLFVNYDIVDLRQKGTKIDVDFNGNLYNNQKQAEETMLNHDNGIVVAPTAFGKTILAISLISKLKTSTLILVNNVNLINQWKEKLNLFLNVNYPYENDKNKFGVFYGQKKKLTFKIDIASIHYNFPNLMY